MWQHHKIENQKHWAEYKKLDKWQTLNRSNELNATPNLTQL
jgi:hypothetical protein